MVVAGETIDSDNSLSNNMALEPYVSGNTDVSSYTNIMFIDNLVEDAKNQDNTLFSGYCNDTTYPLVYKYNTDRESIMEFLANFNSNDIERISFAFHGPSQVDDSIKTSTNFIHNEPLFVDNDVVKDADTFSDNVTFVKNLITLFPNLKNVDFLGCNLLNLDNYKQYFELLKVNNDNLLIGASDDNTGNVKTGGDWTMETTMENVKNIYFNDTIDNYTSLLQTGSTFSSVGLNYIVTSPSHSVFRNGGTAYITSGNPTGVLQIPRTAQNVATFYTYNITAIGNNAFKDRTNLTEVTFSLPSYVTSIGSSAFRGSSLTTITIPDSVTSIGFMEFYGATSLTSITIPTSVTSIGTSVFQGASSLTSITIPESVTSIGVDAFRESGLTSITIPASVTSIGRGAFYGALKLKTVYIADGVTSIGANAFYNASSLTSITIPASVTIIGDDTFYGATSLTSITIPEGVTSIGTGAFYNASNLTSITIPASVTIIGDDAFEGALKLKTVYIADGQLGITSPSNGPISFKGATDVNIYPVGAVVLPEAINGIITIPAPSSAISGSESEKNAKRSVFISNMFKSNKTKIESASKLVASATALGVDPSIVTKANVRVLLGSTTNTEYPSGVTNFNVSDLDEDEGVYVHLPAVGDEIKLTVNGKFVRVIKANSGFDLRYNDGAGLAENVDEGYTGKVDGLDFVIGSVTAQNNGTEPEPGSGGGSSGAMVPICFPAGTPVMTDKGEIAIEKLNPDVHTIRGKSIVAITETNPLFKYIIRIEKDALGKNVPCRRTEISRDHEVFYKGKMMRSEELVEKCEGVYRIKYHRETLYNVLMEKHDKMIINNLICETLHPRNIMALISRGKYTKREKKKICDELNEALMKNDVNGCKKLYRSLR